jgi:Fic family protein
MILSKMKPPDITSEILKYIASISEKIGVVNAKFLTKTNPTLRKQNQIKTIHSSLSIEGNTLSEEQITQSWKTNVLRDLKRHNRSSERFECL